MQFDLKSIMNFLALERRRDMENKILAVRYYYISTERCRFHPVYTKCKGSAEIKIFLN
jgi:hypothetical protein